MKSFKAFFQQQGCEQQIAIYQQRPISQQQFISDIAKLSTVLRQQDSNNYCLFHRQTYPFAVALFALALTNKTIVIPGNNTADTLSSLTEHCDAYLGDLDNSCLILEDFLLSPIQADASFTLNDSSAIAITVFTSGSSGEAKAIQKSLAQFEAETFALEQRFGPQLNNETPATVIATVSHQHIYGLIFRIFWPLLAQRVFDSEQILDNALALRLIQESQTPVIWVASPAHLKRLEINSRDFTDSNKLLAVFSSGGPLTAEAAEHCQQQLGLTPIEVFGSSETGGIASRQQLLDQRWLPLPNIEVQRHSSGALLLRSPHLGHDNWYQCDDAVTIDSEGKFELKGRLDRIIKLEEKRLSLVEMESQINANNWVADNHCLVLTADTNSKPQRDTLACVCQLSEQGLQQLDFLGKRAFVNAIKQQLRNHFELSLIPKKWRFIDLIPQNSQAKIDKIAIQELFLTP